MTKIKISAILFATLISVTTQSSYAQSSTRPTPIGSDSLLGELESQVDGNNINGIVSDQVLPEPIDSNAAIASGATGQEISPQISGESPLVQGNAVQGDVVDNEFFQSDFSDQSNLAPGLLGSFFRSPSGVNRVWGIGGVFLSRGRFNDEVQFSNNTSSDQVLQDLGGLNLSVTTRNAGGRGWEFRYTGLFEDTDSADFVTPNVSETVVRSSELHNFELNLLRQQRSHILWTIFDLHESTIGIRYLRFDESLDFSRTSQVGDIRLATEVENSLFGIQGGRRLEKRIYGKLGVFSEGKLGIFSNRARNNNFTTNPNNFTATRESKTDVAFLGELDTGLVYTFNQSVRLKGGYRALGVTGVALADGQFNQDLTIRDTVNTAGDLFLRGGYFTFEFVY